MNPQAPIPGTPTLQGLQLATLAFELGLITRDQMCRALLDWVPDQGKSLSALMVTAGYLSENDRELLDQLARRHAESSASLDVGLQHLRQHLAAVTLGDTASPAQREAAHTLSRTLREHSRDQRQTGAHDTPGQDAAASEEFVARGLTELNASSHRFRLIKPHAVGGLGVVSVAHDVELDREVAVKEIRPNACSDDAVQRFLLEARVTGQLDHPGIPPVYALGYFEDGRPFYVMRLIEGKTLKEAIAEFHDRFKSPDTSRERSLELRKLLGAMVSVCNTLRFAHSRNVLHRDIKPSNIMLGEYGETLVLDWGLAKNKEQSLPFSINDAKALHTKRKADDPTQTGTGSVMGTPHYMSPEQARGEWESVNVRSDVYSVGATLYSLLTGHLPFSGSTRDEVRDQVRRGNFKRPRQVDARVPESLDAICVKAMSLQREDRFANTGELASEIEHWLADEPVNSFRESAVQRWQRWIKARQSLVASLTLLMVTGFVALTAGFIVVSSQFQSVNQATFQVDRINRQAHEQLTQARQLVLSSLLVDNDKRLALVPGTDGIRLQMIDEAIRLLTDWSQAEPLNPQYQLDLAGAYRERHRIHSVLHQPYAAWSDLVRSLGIVEQYLMAADRKVRLAANNQRQSLLPECVVLLSEIDDKNIALEFAWEVQSHARLLLNRRPNEVALRMYLSQANLSLSKLLIDFDQTVQAWELIDEAATHLERMRHDVDRQSVELQIAGGQTVIDEVTIEAKKMQAFVTYALGNWQMAIEKINEALELTAQFHDENGLKPLVLENHLQLRILKLKIETEYQLSPVGKLLIEFDELIEWSRAMRLRFQNNAAVERSWRDLVLCKLDLLIKDTVDESAIQLALMSIAELPSHSAAADEQWYRFRLYNRLVEAWTLRGDFSSAQLYLSLASQALVESRGWTRYENYESELARLQTQIREISAWTALSQSAL